MGIRKRVYVYEAQSDHALLALLFWDGAALDWGTEHTRQCHCARASGVLPHHAERGEARANVYEVAGDAACARAKRHQQNILHHELQNTIHSIKERRQKGIRDHFRYLSYSID